MYVLYLKTHTLLFKYKVVCLAQGRTESVQGKQSLEAIMCQNVFQDIRQCIGILGSFIFNLFFLYIKFKQKI